MLERKGSFGKSVSSATNTSTSQLRSQFYISILEAKINENIKDKDQVNEYKYLLQNLQQSVEEMLAQNV